MDKSPPKGKLSRSGVVGKALVRIGVAHTKGIVKRKLGSKNQSEHIKDETHEEVADIIFNALGELKGVSVKIAQQIALGMPFLSPIYLQKISQSFNTIPPINKALVRQIIKQELGSYPNEIFEEFEAQAFAGASLGQVHKIKDKGRDIALKIQYPAIKKSIQSDMFLIHYALKRFAKGQNVEHLISEIESRLYEEVEYELEAKNYHFFATQMKMDGVVIPKVYEEFSTSKVLATEFIFGHSLEEYLATNPTQESKNAYAQLIFDSFFYSLYHLGLIHADPNPANFIFMEDGKLAMIDFGCIKKVDAVFLKAYNALHLALIEDVSDEEIMEHYIKFDMIPLDTKANMQSFYKEVIFPLERFYIEPLMEERYDFKIHHDFSKRGFETIFEVQKKQYNSVHKLNEEYIFLDRTLLGYYAMFEKMEATIETKFAKELMKQKKGVSYE